MQVFSLMRMTTAASGVSLVADIGGTNARFALLDENHQPADSTTLRCNDYPSLTAAIRTFMEQRGAARLEAAAIAVATPVTGDRVKLTNNPWSFSINETRAELNLDRLHVVNDWTALALSVKNLPADELQKVGGGEAVPGRAIGLIGPGTGLGVSGLIPCGPDWTALQGEGGHVTLGVRTDREFDVYGLLRRRFQHVSAERFLSGPGLVNIHDALRELDEQSPSELSPAAIAAAAVDRSDPVCVETLEIFCQLLGSCAGNLALTLGAEGGVYIGGGIVPKLGGFFVESAFREHFEAKGRLSPYVQKIPTYVMHSAYPALFGAAQLLR